MKLNGEEVWINIYKMRVHAPLERRQHVRKDWIGNVRIEGNFLKMSNTAKPIHMIKISRTYSYDQNLMLEYNNMIDHMI